MKKILIIADTFAPQNKIGAVRASKLAKHLANKRFYVTIITTTITEDEKIDETLNTNNLGNVTINRITNNQLFSKTLLLLRNKLLNNGKPGSSLFVENKKSLFNKIKNNILKYGLFVYKSIENHLWKREVLKYISKAYKDIIFDVVISTYPNLSSHRIGQELLRTKKARQWIADFRDPIAYDSLNTAIVYGVNIRRQKKICNSATKVTYVTKNMIETLSKGVHDLENFFYLPNGFDNDDLQYIDSVNYKEDYTGYFRIAYVGNLYGGKRDLSILFKFLAELISENKINQNKIKFFYAGNEFELLKNQASKYKLSNILLNLGFVSREESLKIQNQSNLIIVNTWNTAKDKGVIPGKVYECFLLKKPTLAIINGDTSDSELGHMITKSGLGVVCETMNKDDLSNKLVKIFLSNMYLASITNSNYPIEINYDYIEQFNYTKITDRLIKIMKI